MNDISPAESADRVAECHTRAAADRVRAEGMDTENGRRGLEQSAASWALRGDLLGRLDASFDKRERLDAEARRFHSAQRTERLAETESVSQWEGEGGATVSPWQHDGQPEDQATRQHPDTGRQPPEKAEPTSLQALGYAGLTAIIALPVMMLGYRWFVA